MACSSLMQAERPQAATAVFNIYPPATSTHRQLPKLLAKSHTTTHACTYMHAHAPLNLPASVRSNKNEIFNTIQHHSLLLLDDSSVLENKRHEPTTALLSANIENYS